MKPDSKASMQAKIHSRNAVAFATPLRKFSVHMLATVALTSIASMNLSSCAGSDLGKDLSISAAPSDSYIVSSNASSCVDLYSASTITAQSVTPPRLYYPNFKLQWRGTTPLTVSVIRVTVIGNNTKALSPSVTTLSSNEVSVLLGQVNGVIPPGITINSNESTNRGIFPACGLNIGGLAITDSSPPSIPASSISSFTARVMIEVIGTYQSSDLTYHPVKQSWIGSARYN